MFLQKLEIQGFKSFAEKITFLFPAWDADRYGITAVIGPNGSGKSNVADAVRWVLGEQSLKTLRSKRAEDVIFFGSHEKAQKGFCEVSLFFNNEDHAFPLDFAEVAIARRLYRDGASEYFLNKNKVRLSDITLLLAQAHIGQRTYSVIGQGMIDAILHTAPAERKEFFDEAVGVRQYQLKKESALAKLKNTREHLNHAATIIEELEPKMRFFSRQLKRLEEREAVEKELHDIQSAYYNVVWNDLKEKMDTLQHERADVQKELDSHGTKQQERTMLFVEEEKKSHGAEHASSSDLQRHFDELQKRFGQIQSRISVLDGRLNLDLTQSGKGQLAWLSGKYEELGAQVTMLREEMVVLKNQSNDFEDKEKILQKKVAGHVEQNEPFSNSDLVSDIAMRVDALLDMYTQNQNVPSSLDALEKVFRAMHEGLNEIKKKVTHFLNVEHALTKNDDAKRLYAHDAEELQEIRTRTLVLNERLALRQAEKERTEQEYARIEKEIAYFSSSDISAQQEALLKERHELLEQRIVCERDIEAIKSQRETFYAAERETGRRLLDLQKEISALQREHEEIQARATRLDLEGARIQTHQEELLGKIIDDLRIEQSHADELIGHIETPYSVLGFSHESPHISLDVARSDIERLKRKREQIGTIDSDVVSEYEETKQRYEYLTGQMNDLQEAKESLDGAIKELDEIIKERFEKNLEAISKKFSHYFNQLFDGGTARLIIQRSTPHEREEGEEEDGEDEEGEKQNGEVVSGIEIEATPPGKKFKQLSFLSGGEKAMTAIALLCAILAQNPSPFVILDEVDAALDESNANRFAGIIQELSTQTQFILITHNRVTMHTGRVLYGVTMGADGISRVLSLDIRMLDGIVAQ